MQGETPMRVWRINDAYTIAGPTLLSALRAACRECGCAWWELLDREHFGEIQPTEWPNIGVYDLDDPNNLNLTLWDVVASQKKPGIVMSTEW